MWPGDAAINRFYVNSSVNNNRWVKIRLRGTKSNSFGVGAKIEIRARNAEGTPIVRFAEMNNKSGFGSSPLLAHIGLADATEIDSVEVFWPISKAKKRYEVQFEVLNVLRESPNERNAPVT